MKLLSSLRSSLHFSPRTRLHLQKSTLHVASRISFPKRSSFFTQWCFSSYGCPLSSLIRQSESETPDLKSDNSAPCSPALPNIKLTLYRLTPDPTLMDPVIEKFQRFYYFFLARNNYVFNRVMSLDTVLPYKFMQNFHIVCYSPYYKQTISRKK